MNYMLLIYQEENSSDEPKDEHSECIRTCEGLVDRLDAKGQYVAGGILQPSSQARSVQVRDGKRLLTDGPFAETREQLAGYLMIDAANMEEAISIAVQHPVVRTGTVEIRPVREVPFLTPVVSAAKSEG